MMLGFVGGAGLPGLQARGELGDQGLLRGVQSGQSRRRRGRLLGGSLLGSCLCGHVLSSLYRVARKLLPYDRAMSAVSVHFQSSAGTGARELHTFRRVAGIGSVMHRVTVEPQFPSRQEKLPNRLRRWRIS